MIRIDSKVVCIASETVERKYGKKPRFGDVLQVSNIVVENNKTWFLFYEVSRKIKFNSIYFRAYNDAQESKVVANLYSNNRPRK